MEEQRNEDRKYFSRIGLAYFTGGILSELLANAVYRLLLMWRPEWSNNTNIGVIVSTVVIYFICLPIVILMVKRIPGNAPTQHSMKPHQWLGALVSCYAVGYTCNIIGLLLTAFIGALKGSAVENPALNTISSLNVGISFVCTVLIAPTFEEFVFRKLLLDRTRKYGEGMAVLLSGLMFGLFHGNLNQFAYAFTLGLALAFVYLKTGKIQYTIGIHMCINLVGGVVAPFAMQMLDYEEYMRRYLIAIEFGDMAGLYQYMMEHALGIILLMGVGLFAIGAILAGLIVLIVNCKRIRFAKGEITIPKGERFKTVILNVGMLLFSLFWIFMILLQIFS